MRLMFLEETQERGSLLHTRIMVHVSRQLSSSQKEKPQRNSYASAMVFDSQTSELKGPRFLLFKMPDLCLDLTQPQQGWPCFC